MRKSIILLLSLLAATPLLAQRDDRPHRGPKHAEITELVGDLSPQQKHKVETFSRDSRHLVDDLKAQKSAVRDSIAKYMEMDGDNTRRINAFFEQEAQLQVAINREMYNTKLRIDEVLTPDQRKQLRSACQKERQAPERRPKAAKPEMNPKFKK